MVEALGGLMRVETVCAVCHEDAEFGDKGTIQIRMPSWDADFICFRCWCITMGAALLWLKAEGNTAQDALKAVVELRLAADKKN